MNHSNLTYVWGALTVSRIFSVMIRLKLLSSLQNKKFYFINSSLACLLCERINSLSAIHYIFTLCFNPFSAYHIIIHHRRDEFNFSNNFVELLDMPVLLCNYMMFYGVCKCRRDFYSANILRHFKTSNHFFEPTTNND